MRKNLFLLIILGLYALSHASGKTFSVNKLNGPVPDSKTAILIAVAVWNPVFGKKQIASEKPYKASLSRGVWLVQGTLPKGWEGGVAYATIRKRDGRVMSIFHLQ